MTAVNTKRATRVLHKWARVHINQHLEHHRNGRQHSLHFNLADTRDTLEKFGQDHPRYAKALLEMVSSN